MPLTPSLTKFTTASPVLVNYDWTDVVGGYGILTFDCWATDKPAAGTTYNLSKNLTYYSYPYWTGAATQSATYVAVATVAFVTGTFNKPLPLDGTGYIEVPVVLQPQNSSVASVSRLTVTIAGSTAGTVASAVSYEKTLAAGIGFKNMWTLPLTFSDKQLVKGETLTCTVLLECKKTAGDGGQQIGGMVAYSPHNLDTAWNFNGADIKPSVDTMTTKLKLSIPIKMDN